MRLKQWTITDRYQGGVIVERERNGRISAIRFAPGMTLDEVKQSLQDDPPVRSDWRPFNQSTGCFCQ